MLLTRLGKTLTTAVVHEYLFHLLYDAVGRLEQERAFSEIPMDALAEKLDTKLRQWTPETTEQVRQCVAEIMALADQDALDLLRSRMVEQEVLEAIRK